MTDICTECGRPKRKLKRSEAQNALYWMWVNIIAKEIGYTKDELHEIFKAEWMDEFKDPELIEYNGKKIQRRYSTKDLGVGDFTGWLNKVEQVATTMNIKLLYPEDKYGLAMGHI